MLFNSFEFGIFIVIVLAIYYALATKPQNIFLLAVSYLFYGWWDWRFTTLIAFSTIVDFIIAPKIARTPHQPTGKKLLFISIFVNLGILAFFKYFNFFSDSLRDIFNIFGHEPSWATLHIILPVGISFYTFQSMAYTIDVYRGRMKPVRNFVDFALYVSFFPQLVAGPIERAQNLIPQIQSKRTVDDYRISSGLLLIFLGLFLKVVVADSAASFVDRCFDFPGIYSSLGLLLGIYLFALQIYADFAGYSSVARGLAKLLGFDLMINFKQPYFSRDITEFWRRWHISLSSWLRDYLYIPLGGNRKGKRRTYINLMITMLLGGLWHGAAWAFVVWGALHGIYLAVHKWWMESRNISHNSQRKLRWRQLPSIFVTFNLVCLAWIFFRAVEFQLAWEYLSGIVALRGPWLDFANPGKVLEPLVVFIALIIVVLLVDIPRRRANDPESFIHARWPIQLFYYAIFIAGLMIFGGGDEVPFIYFQF